MLDGVLIVVIGLIFFMGVEYFFPYRQLPQVPGWYFYAFSVNFLQLFIGLLAYVLEDYLNFPSRINLKMYVSDFLGGVIAYAFMTWVMYWWHYFRHNNYILWRTMHQFHHSAQSIEALTSFYKHPLEMIVNSIIMIIITYPILGVSGKSSMWLSIFAGFGEFIYHVNIWTPYWLGFFFQTPLSHLLHHKKNARIYCPNLSDCPLWDILGGTFKNNDDPTIQAGFDQGNDQKIADMLMFGDAVYHDKKIKITWDDICVLIILSIGCISIIGYVSFSPTIQGIGFITTSSPLPLVFSAYNDVETFSLKYSVIKINNDIEIDLHDAYSRIKGPYNLRNVYGAMFSYGPLFTNDNLIKLRQDILHWGICKQKIMTLPSKIMNASVEIKSGTKSFENNKWYLHIIC